MTAWARGARWGDKRIAYVQTTQVMLCVPEDELVRT